MSDFSGEHGFIPEWLSPALLLFGLAPVALVMFLGGTVTTLVVGVGVLLVVAGLAVLGWRLWGWVRGWRTDRVLRREDDESAWASPPDSEPNQITPGQEW